jgi:hypothetical protein
VTANAIPARSAGDGAQPERPVRRTSGRSALTVTAGFALLALVLTAPIAWRGAATGPINTGDGQLSIWNVAWVARTIAIDPAHVYDANIFAPHRATLAYSEANLPAGLLGFPAWWLTGNPYAAYNTAVVLSLLLAALATFGLARHLTRSTEAATVAAIIFAFAPFVTVRYAHIQLLVTAGLPLSLLALHRFVDRPTPGRAACISGAIAFAGLSCGYYGFFAAIAVGLGMAYYAVVRGLWRRPHYVALCLAAALGTALAILPFFLPYLDLLRDAQPFRTLDDARQYSATWRSYLTSTAHLHRLIIERFLPFDQADFPERVLFPGFLGCGLGACAIVTALRSRAPRATTAWEGPGASETVGFYAVLAAIAAWFSLGPRGWLYTAAYEVVPAWSLLRAPSRFGILVSLALAVLAAVSLAGWLAGRQKRRWIGLALAALAVADVAAVPWDVREAVPVPAAYRLLAKLPPGGVASFPFFFRPIDFHRHSIYMLYSTVHWHPIVNGYSDRIPEDFKAMVIPVSSFPAWEAFGILKRHGTRYVVFHLDWYDGRSREKLLERIDRYKLFLRPMVQQDDVWLYEIAQWPE